MTEHRLDISQSHSSVREAAVLAHYGNVTWLTEEGRNVAAIVPAEAARAWLEAREDLEEITRITGRLRNLVRVYDRAQGGSGLVQGDGLDPEARRAATGPWEDGS